MKSQYWFQVIKRGYDRYSWVLVEARDGRVRVLAHSARDYSSKKKTRKAIERVMGAAGDAQVLDEACGYPGFDVPMTRFEVDPYVFPLPVRDPMLRHARGKGRRRSRGRWMRSNEPIELPCGYAATARGATPESARAASDSSTDEAPTAAAAQDAPEPAPAVTKVKRGSARAPATSTSGEG